MQIQHLRHKSIDYEKWDLAIKQSINHLGYAYSWYLDIVSPGWEALVSDDYKYVMPLPVKRKYKIPYLTQPALTQQLGIFSKNEISEEIIQLFIKKIPYYSYQINLNECNFNSDVIKQTNYILKTDDSYENIAQKYSKNTIRNIEKAHKNRLKIKEYLSVDEFLKLFSEVNPDAAGPINNIYKPILTKGHEKAMIRICGAYTTENELISGLSLFFTGNRIVCLLLASNDNGKKTSAMFLLIDHLIETFAASDKIIDFEGSMIDGIARFYKGFGAENQPYFILKKMRPAFLVKTIQRLS